MDAQKKSRADLNSLPTRQYLDQTVNPILLPALKGEWTTLMPHMNLDWSFPSLFQHLRKKDPPTLSHSWLLSSRSTRQKPRKVKIFARTHSRCLDPFHFSSVMLDSIIKFRQSLKILIWNRNWIYWKFVSFMQYKAWHKDQSDHKFSYYLMKT